MKLATVGSLDLAGTFSTEPAFITIVTGNPLILFFGVLIRVGNLGLWAAVVLSPGFNWAFNLVRESHG